MSFVFPKPVPATRNSSAYSYSGPNYTYPLYDDTCSKHYTLLLCNPEPDYDELSFRLSLYAFTRLSPPDQREQVEEIRHNVKVEDVLILVEEQGPEESDEAFRTRTFAELFKKLSYSDQQVLFLSKVIEKFKSERQLEEFISSFKQLDMNHQQQLIDESAVHLVPKNILMHHGETEEDFRLRQFTQLCRDHTDHVYKLLININNSEDDEQEETSDDNESSSDWKSCFADFFSGFSAIWFKGQSKRGQDLLIEQLSDRVTGVAINNRLLRDETEEDFKLRKFTELCNKVADFKVQDGFLYYAILKLAFWGVHYAYRLIGEPQDCDSASKLLSRLSAFGFSRLSAKYQQQKIKELSNKVEGFPIKSRLAIVEESMDDQEDIRVERFTELFNQVPVPTQKDLFKELRRILLQQKRYSDAVHFFKGLCCEDQTETLRELESVSESEEDFRPRRFTKVCHFFKGLCELVIEKFSGESKEDFRLRRFTKVCVEHLSTLGYIRWPEAYQERVREGTSDYSPYAEFLFDVSVAWFKARCSNYRRNPIHIILFGEVEIRDVIEKLPEENEENFRLRRFTDSFKQLQMSSQESIVGCIENELFRDFDLVPRRCLVLRGGGPLQPSSEGRGLFDSEWTAMTEEPVLLDQGAAAANTRGRGAGGSATAQAGGGTDPRNGGCGLSDMCLIC